MTDKLGVVEARYYALPSPKLAPADTLLSLALRFGESNRLHYKVLTANCLGEAAVQLPAGSDARRSLVQQAQKRFGMASGTALRAEAAMPAARLTLGLPVIRSGPTLEAQAKVQNMTLDYLRNLGRAAARVTDRTASGQSSFISGSVGESIALVTANVASFASGTNTPDLYAVPSFERQDQASARVDGRPYRFDINLVSGGRQILPGTYHVAVGSVRTATPAGAVQYAASRQATLHPAVVAINPTELYGLPAGIPLSSVIPRLPATSRDPVPPFVADARHRLLQLLQQHGPSQLPEA